jgi:hypothetical protein
MSAISGPMSSNLIRSVTPAAGVTVGVTGRAADWMVGFATLPPASAAPRAIAVVGSSAATTRTRVAADTSSATSGMLAQPPTSTTARTASFPESASASAAALIARCSIRTVCSTAGRIIASKSLRLTSTVAFFAGCGAGMVTATAVESRSFAVTHAARSAASAAGSGRSPRSAVACSASRSSNSSPPSTSVLSAWERSSNPNEPRRSTAASNLLAPSE